MCSEVEEQRARWRAAVAGVLAKSSSARSGRPGRRARAPAGLADLRGLPDPRALHRAGRAAGAAAARRLAVRPRRRRAARRQVGLEGRRGVPGRRLSGAVADGNGAVLVALDRRGQRAGAAGRRDATALRPAELDRLLEGVFLDLVPVVLDAGADFVGRRRRGAGAGGRRWTTTSARRLSIDLGADPLTAPLSGAIRAPTSTTSSRPPRRSPATPAACGRSPSTGPRFTTSAPARPGSWPEPWPQRSAICGCSASGGIGVAGRVAADQLPAGRRRRPVHDDREIPCGCANSGRGSPRWSASPTPAPPACTRSPRCR